VARVGRGELRALASLAALTLAAALVRVLLWRALPLQGAPPDDGFARAAGVVHVHTTLSDGGGAPDEVIRAAHASGLAFLGLTDHNNLDAKPFEGYRDGVLVLVGAELSTPAGHLLGIGLDRDPAFRWNGDAQDAVDDVLHLGGVPVAAHPFSARAELRWRAFDLQGPWGLELVNSDSDARRAGPRLLLTATSYRLNADYALLAASAPMDEALSRWDELLAQRDVVGLAGADAHSRLALARGLTLRFPAYDAVFRQAKNHLLLERPLTGDAAADRAAVLEALRRGRFYVGRDALADASDFSFTVRDAHGRRYTMGDSVEPGDGLQAIVRGRVPDGTRIALLRDGKPLAEGSESLEAALPGPGVYRVEAHVDGWSMPWIVTNPIYVFDATARAARAARSSWPPPAPAVHESRPLAAFGAPPAFAPEHDPRSDMDAAATAPGAGPDGRDGLKLAFRLAAPTAAEPFTWCALVDRAPRDLSGWSGLRFRLKGDGEYRLWVQLRDRNPASTDEGLEWWMASARTSPEWTDVLVPFARLRTLNPKSDGHVDPNETRVIVFVLDPATVKPGTKGTIWISDVGVYR
jgi:hypothetical protein